MTSLCLESAVQKWELISTQLEDTLAAYVNASIVLESFATECLIDTNHITSRLELEIDVTYIRLTNQLAQSRSHLARARNKLTTTVYHLPEEIIAAIFSAFINGIYGKALAFEDGIQSTYQRLYTLLRVCSDWQRIILTRGAFWSLVPVLGLEVESHMHSAITLSLERSLGSGLYLAGNVGKLPNETLRRIITQYGPRFCVLNLYGDTYDTLRDAVAHFLQYGTPGHVTDFSVGYKRRSGILERHHLFPPFSAEYTALSNFASSLQNLRVRGFPLYWNTMSFTRLVELLIQDAVFEDPSMVEDFLLAIASAPTLRSVQIISIQLPNFRDSTNSHPPNQRPGLPIMLPSLQSFYLQDLHLNLIELILRSITLGSYQTVLNFTRESCFYGLIAQDRILHTEKLALLPPVDAGAGSHNNFPEIHTLYFWDCMIVINNKQELALFKEAVNSHGIQELGFGLPEGLPWVFRPHPRISSNEGHEYTASIKEWLEANVPKFKLVRTPNDLPNYDFQTALWRLW